MPREIKKPKSDSAEAVETNNDEVLNDQAEAQLAAEQEPVNVPEFSDEQKEYLEQMMQRATAAGVQEGIAIANHKEAPMASSARQLKDVSEVNPEKIEKAELTNKGWVCPKPKKPKAA